MFKNALFLRYLTVLKLLEHPPTRTYARTHARTCTYVCTYKYIKKFTYTKLQNIFLQI